MILRFTLYKNILGVRKLLKKVHFTTSVSSVDEQGMFDYGAKLYFQFNVIKVSNSYICFNVNEAYKIYFDIPTLLN